MLTPKSGEQKVENQDQIGERIPGKENIKDLNIKNPYDDRSKENSLALLRLIKTRKLQTSMINLDCKLFHMS